MDWQIKSFGQLTTDELYDFLKLRIDVFVVEQTCYYPDLDELDRHPQTLHVFCYENGKILGYLRILPKGTTYEQYNSIGRVIIAESARGTGLGHELVRVGINACQTHFSEKTIKISAQQHLSNFYQQHQFKQVTEMYLEDGIPHIGMLLDK
ncbi:GNAT family N-acetyltransferase [Thalassotalea sp. M1531]|uniref:GNAT family N-acetyltransferase n=1 Tax=Thalassotalea algicola TaxID=2716224 RepID=A0A7Y0LB66_9GAMM|nr:GNAT family N-acetyltransferase [Thalassotalea algicola]NMP31320.1 GNAT family N-acetyltransferase [Thalassotalea algicola]